MKLFASFLGLTALLVLPSIPALAAPARRHDRATSHRSRRLGRRSFVEFPRRLGVRRGFAPLASIPGGSSIMIPSVDSHGRAVKVANGQVVRAYPAQGGVVYANSLTFAPGDARGIGQALSTAEDYAAQHSIGYNQAPRAFAGHLRWRPDPLAHPAHGGWPEQGLRLRRRGQRHLRQLHAFRRAPHEFQHRRRFRRGPRRRRPATISRTRSSALAVISSSSSPASARWIGRRVDLPHFSAT